ncbi:sugar ABC transporter permease [Georgenia halophila]|uniref:Sugar ABC transporter permease n=1 Tax=Georgenia halophila TaxID=620889 RepID=A0ABP8LNJ0_9MICO
MSTATTTPVRGPENRARRPWWERVLGKHPMGTAFSLPYVVFLVVVFAYPFGMAIWMSFHDYMFTAPGVTIEHPFVGLDNYVAALTDPDVRQSFVNTGIFLAIYVPLTVVGSIVLASILNTAVRWAAGFRVAFYVPYVTASVSLVGVWLLLFSQNGLVNTVLGPLAPDPSWLINSGLAMPTIALYVTWKQLGFFILLYLAALQGIPRDLYEAASLEGAGAVRKFWHITVPGVRTVSVLVLILAVIIGAGLFTEPYLLTNGGGPNGASTTPVLLIYQKGIQQTNPDVASAIGLILVILVGLLALIANRVGKER